MILPFLVARAVQHGSEIAPDETSITLLLTPFLLTAAGAYIVGAPAAFAVGAAMQAMRERGVKMMPWLLFTNLLLGSALSAMTICGLDLYILPHPHLDAAPMFGERVWFAVAGIGGGAAIICTLFQTARDTFRPQP